RRAVGGTGAAGARWSAGRGAQPRADVRALSPPARADRRRRSRLRPGAARAAPPGRAGARREPAAAAAWLPRSTPSAATGPVPNRSAPADHAPDAPTAPRSEEHTSELQSLRHLVCRLLLEKKKK